MGMPVNDLNALFQAHIAGAAAVADTGFKQTINLAPFTEDVSWAYFTLGAAAKSGLTKVALVDGHPVTLAEITSSSVYGTMSWNVSASGYTPFVAGKPYLLSAYVWTPVGFWWHHRAHNSNYGQGPVYCRANELTRVWWVGYAYSTTGLDHGSSPSSAAGSVNEPLGWIAFNNNKGVQTGSTLGEMLTGAAPYIGGFQIEGLPSTYRDGVAMIGDSTFAGSGGWTEGGSAGDIYRDWNVVSNVEVATVLGSELRVPIFNRAIGGQRLDQMDTRWETDITPLVSRCHAVIIQGGINDISQSRTLSQMQASVASMTAKATADGFRKVYYANVTPFATASGDPTKESLRVAYNAWLASTYGADCADIASIVTDPATGKDLISAAYGDGTHYPGAAKTAVAAYMSKSLDWSWRIIPGKYQPNRA